MTNAERVRHLLGESGEDADSIFTDDLILELLEQAEDVVESAVAEGWRLKAAQYAELVDTAEGTSKRSMSDLHKNALAMAATYSNPATASSTAPTTRIRPIVRR